MNEILSVLSIFMIFISSIDNSTCACQIRAVNNEISISVNFISCARKGEVYGPSEVVDYVKQRLKLVKSCGPMIETCFRRVEQT